MRYKKSEGRFFLAHTCVEFLKGIRACERHTYLRSTPQVIGHVKLLISHDLYVLLC